MACVPRRKSSKTQKGVRNVGYKIDRGFAPLQWTTERRAPKGPASRLRSSSLVVSAAYLMILRASRPPPTSRAPAPRPRSEAVPLPPVFGSSLGGGGGGGGPGGGGGGG